MTEWSIWLAPLAVFVVLLLFRFVGCESLLGIDDVSYAQGPSGPEYAKTVLSDSPVSYWRLQEKHTAEPSPGPSAPNTPVSGGTASDARGTNPGTYRAVIVVPGAQFPDSPSAPQPPGSPSITLESPGLLELGGPSTSALVDGGYVEVALSNSLVLKSFTVEALVFPEWGAGETGLFRAVIGLNTVALPPDPTKAFGFGLFAGPVPGASGGPDVWQVWLGDGTDFKPVKDPNRILAPVDFTKINYIGVTYDDSTKKLNMYVYVRGVDLSTDLAHPVSDVTVSYSPVTDQTKSLLIGMHRPPVGSALPVYHSFKGRIQEVAVYDKALTVGRVMSHVLAGLNL